MGITQDEGGNGLSSGVDNIVKKQIEAKKNPYSLEQVLQQKKIFSDSQGNGAGEQCGDMEM